jgi:hypothetical protein
LIYVNDILDENGEITEFTIMKKAIPKEWIDIIKTENSKKKV